jgi:hypothetical protein
MQAVPLQLAKKAIQNARIVERQNLTLRMASRQFTRLTNGFSKRVDCHLAAVGLYVAHTSAASMRRRG